ncbi:MAG TPA: hypothetical protein VK095_14655 [Beutenbergiaceae bacterium]|nr:hypothetical protein [Beutenbergiaceae bacterium]
MWWVIWTVLVLGAVGVFVLIGVRLWRAATALLRELNAAAAEFGHLADRIAELDAARTEQRFTPDLEATPQQRDQWRQQRAANLNTRTRRRHQRREGAYSRWRWIGTPL